MRWCWHDWTKWDDPIVPDGLMFPRQHRRCVKCNKTQERVIM